MALKTILVHVDLSRHATARIRAAASLARIHGAHLLGGAMTGIPHIDVPRGNGSPSGTLLAGCQAHHFDEARRALGHFEAIAREMQISCEPRLVCDQPDNGLALMARFADLVVISQSDPGEAMTDMAGHIPEYVILNSARPVLVLPHSDPEPTTAHKVLLAWDGTKEASFAASSAVPLLQQAVSVTVATLIGPNMSAEECRRQQNELRGYLSRQQITPNFLTRKATDSPGSDILLIASSLKCNLLVMGCFGHRRCGEIYLVGASRTVLADVEIPLLLAN